METVSLQQSTSMEQIKRQAVRLMKLHGYYESYNPHRVTVWLVSFYGGRYLAIGGYEQEALDALADEHRLDNFLVDGDDAESPEMDDYNYRLGNASELFLLEHLTMQDVFDL